MARHAHDGIFLCDQATPLLCQGIDGKGINNDGKTSYRVKTLLPGLGPGVDDGTEPVRKVPRVWTLSLEFHPGRGTDADMDSYGRWF